MAYLLDTNVCVRLLRNHGPVLRRLTAADAANCYVSDVSVGELYFGVKKSLFPKRKRARTQAFINNAKPCSFGPACSFAPSKKRDSNAWDSRWMISVCSLPALPSPTT